MAPTRWGIAGPGAIAAKLAPEFSYVADAELLAIGSRSLERAEAFAQTHGAKRAYGSYAELVADPDVELIYVATPHPQHHAIALAALRAGKGVLVEKAFTATLAGAEEVVGEARRRGVFAMEAMWTRFQPAVIRARELLADGAIGDIVAVQADLGVVREYDPADRLFARETGGGALLDLGVYPVSFAQMLLGTPETVSAVGTHAANGVEVSVSLLLGWEDGRGAALTISLRSPLPGEARIFGTHGRIDFLPRFHHPTSFVLHRAEREPESFTARPLGDGYAEEIIEATRSFRAGRKESTVIPLDDTLAVMGLLDRAASQLGVTHREAPEVY